MFQQVVLIGRLGKDPEQRYTPEAKAVTNFDIAVDGGKGQTMWVRIIAWEKLAENCNLYLNKGKLVQVVGVLTPDKETGNPRMFKRQDGSTGTVYEVTARQVTFLSPRDDSNTPPGYSRQDVNYDLF